jgi:APA family basic amino acid/polyamine antiporter
MVADLPRRIGFWGGSAIMVGIIIGVGIFQTPPEIAKMMGRPLDILALWVLGGVLSFFGAVAYAELSTMFPRSGGMYVYLNEGFGGAVAFSFGWTYMILIKPFAAAALTLAFATHLNALLNVRWNPQAIACGMVVILTGLNVYSLRGSSATAIVLTSLKILALAAIVVLGTVLMKGSSANFATADVATPFWAAFAPVMYGVLWTYDGWADVSAISGEVENPQKLLPRILLAGTAATIVIYVAVNIVYFALVPIGEMGRLDTVAPLVMQRLIGKSGANVVTVMILISTLGAGHAATLTGARVTFAQAQDGLLFRFLGRIHPKHQTPHVSLWIQAALCCAAILYLQKFKLLSEGYGFCMWIFHALVTAALLILRAKRPELERPYKCWGYPWVPVVFMGVSIAMTVLYLAHEPWKTTLPWVGVLVLGIPCYWIWKRCSNDVVESSAPERKMSNL